MTKGSVGDRVKIETVKGGSVGSLMPSQKDNLVVIKLDSGYNKAFDKKSIKSMTILEPYKAVAEKVIEGRQNQGLPTIAILHTGGTIASKVDYRTGGVIARFEPAELLEMFPELKEIANLRSRLISNMWSEDMRFSHYNLMAKAIEEEIKQGCKGIIITHGTDTLHYTAAALSFIFESLPVPVILVGAQRSSDRGSSDAGMNLICAARFIASADFAEVAVCMHSSSQDKEALILPGTRSRKFHSSRRDAFKPVGDIPWARVDFEKKTITWEKDSYKKADKNLVKALLFDDKLKVALLKTHPNMYAEEFLTFKGFDGLLIEGFGIGGHIPINGIDDLTKEHPKIAKVLADLIKSGTQIAVSSQTIFGRINMNVYSTGRDQKEIGIFGDYCDMSPETAFIKLAWLLSNFKKADVPRLFETDLRGEISNRSVYDA